MTHLQSPPHRRLAGLAAALSALLLLASCGGSDSRPASGSPYIAAQLDYTMKKPNYVSVLLGFNPQERARRVRGRGCRSRDHGIGS